MGCLFSLESNSNLQSEFYHEQLISAQVLSQSSFNAQTDALINKFFATMEMDVSPSFSAQLLSIITIRANIQSAVHADSFLISIPGSDQYSFFGNFYPLYDNSTFTIVSCVRDKLLERSLIQIQ